MNASFSCDEVLRALNEALTTQDVLEALATALPKSVDAKGLCLALCSDESAQLRVVVDNTTDAAFSRVGCTISIERIAEPTTLSSIDGILGWLEGMSPAVAEKLGALTVLPLRVDARPIGLLILQGGRAVARDDDELARSLMRCVSRALDRARMYDNECRAARRLERLAEISAVLSSSTDLESTILAIGEAYVPVVAEGACIALNELFGGRVHVVGDVTPSAPRRLVALKAHGVALGELQLFGVRARGSGEDLFIIELARRSAVALDVARTVSSLRDAISLRDEFLSVAGHELRTPLTTLRMCLFTMRRFGGADVEVVDRQVARLERLVEQLLDVTKISAGKLALEPEELDLRELVSDAIAACKESRSPSAQRISLNVRGQTCGKWDRLRLSQVVANLLSNALKYGQERDVEVELAGDAATVRLIVRDRGIGIADGMHGRIFERFERAVSSREYAGVGVGLWICRQIVEAHDGSITVESRVGEGATFTVTLPRVRPRVS